MTPPSTQPEPKKTPPARKTAVGDRPPPELALRCPRCDSANTKFCYYNNYSLAQPRHFCKTCRRYWTRGGALRNVPIGGGCRKTKKPKSSFSPLTGDSAGLRFFQTVSPAMDFHLGGLDFPKITPDAGLPSPFPSLGIFSNTCGAVASTPCFSAGFQEISSLNYQNSLITSSIESLSSINQDLHWKLQRQRMAALFLGDDGNHKEALVQQKNQPVFFQDMEAPKKTVFPGGPIDKNYVGCSGGNNICNTGLSTELFFDNSYATVAPAPATSAGNLNEGPGNWSNGIQGLV